MLSSFVKFYVKQINWHGKCKSSAAIFNFQILKGSVAMQYWDGAGNTVEENSSIFSLIRMH